MKLAEGLDADRVVVVDEAGANTGYTPVYARSPKGMRARGSAPRNRGKNTTLISCLTTMGIGPSVLLEGGADKGAFEAYVERVLCPSLRAGQTVVMDNLGAHKTERVRELIEGEGARVLYLPAYSPDYSPIEEAFSKLKGLLRKAGERTREGLYRAISEGLDAITERDARGYFAHCGLLTPAARAQLL